MKGGRMARPKLDRVPFNVTLPREVLERWKVFCVENGKAQNVATEEAIIARMLAALPETQPLKKAARK
jgi:hypothetical protein